MSYILEALKKAEAERHSGATRAFPLPPSPVAVDRKASASGRQWLTIGVPVVAVVLAGVAWISTRNALTVTDSIKKHPAPATVAALPATPVMTKPPAATAPEETSEKPKEKTARKSPEKTQPAKSKAVREPAREAEPRIAMLRELPEHIQREIPAMTIGGYIYSGSRADRSVLINNRLLREGDEIAPGFMLEQMMPNGMVLSYKGYRYRTSY